MDEKLEEKLNSYRLRKRRTEKFDGIKAKFLKMVSITIGQSDTKPSDTQVKIESTQCDDVVDENESTTSTDDTEVVENETQKRSWLTYCTWLIYFLIWATLYAIAIELSFGSVYFMFSLLLGICFNTRVKPRSKKEASAYSVFNENCESIDGTFKAEMFERQLGLRQL